MKDSILCCAFCVGLCMVVGGVIVSNNNKVRNWVRKISNDATEAYSNVKETLEERVKTERNKEERK